jgi:SulP family sulfate permease
MNTNKIKSYFKINFRADLVAGIIVGLISLPLAIAFAVASGARPEQGIYTSIIAGLVIGVLSGSRYQISGPTGAFVVILLGIVNKFGMDGLMLAGFMAGIILLLFGIFKFGSTIKYIPYPVVIGFTSGIGVTIFSGEIKDFFGLSFDKRPEGFVDTIHMVVSNIENGFNLSAVIIGLVTIIAWILWKRYSKTFPPAPIALAAGIIASIAIELFFTKWLPKPILVGLIPSGLPTFHMIDFSLERIELLLPSAFTIAILGAIESLLSAVVADGMTGTKHNSNKELIAQGIGNMVLPLFGGIPATGAIARTAANIKSGAKTRMSSIIHSITLLLIVLIFGTYAKYIPLSALAGILMMVAYNMAELPHFLHLLKAPRQDAAVLVTTFLLTVFVDLTTAVGIGIVLASLLFIQRVSKLSVSNVLDSEDIGTEGSKLLHESLEKFPQIRLYELSGALFFGVASELENSIHHGAGEILILRMKHVHHMDATALNALDIIVERAMRKKGGVYLSTASEKILKKLDKYGILKKIGGRSHCPKSTTKAIELAKEDLHATIGDGIKVQQ